MRVIIHVDLVPRLRVPVGELVDVAREVIVADYFVQGVSIGIRIVGSEPIRVLVNDGVTSDGIDVGIELAHGSDEFVPGNLDVLLAVDLEELGQVVDDEVKSLLGVRAHEYARLFEGGGRHRTLGSLVQKSTVYDGHEGKLAYALGTPLAVYQGYRVLGQQTVYGRPNVRLVVGTTHRLGKTQTTQHRLVPAYYRPGRGRGARLHDRLVKQVSGRDEESWVN